MDNKPLYKPFKSKAKNKKYSVYVMKDGKKKLINFGDSRMEQYKDKERRERYRKRHAKDLKTNDPMRAGYLSFYILWGDSTSFNKNVASYKKRFDL